MRQKPPGLQDCGHTARLELEAEAKARRVPSDTAPTKGACGNQARGCDGGRAKKTDRRYF